MRKIIKKYRKFQLSLSPQQNLLYGFSIYAVIGWLLLCLPIVQKQAVSALDSLFIATSAISTTGLVTLSIFDTYNKFGQFIIMLLFQIGGIGYMTFTTFILLSKKSGFTHWHQRILNAEFTMPKGFQIKDFLKSVIIFTVIIEILGALCFYIAFTNAGVEHNFAIWSSIYHSVSAFCTAGFGLYDDSFEQFAGNTAINTIISVLAICGSLGFIVVTDFWNRLSGKIKQVTYTTKIILGAMTLLLVMGTVMIYFFEPSVNQLGAHKLMASFFQAMTALTTVGFNTVPLGNFSLGILLVIIFLMYIGASPSGTGGGMKTTTLTALIAIMWNRIRNNKRITFLGKTIPLDRLYVATSIFMLYASVIFMATLLLAMTEDFSLKQILFETTSAIGTVGLSTGITGSLSSWGKLVIIFVMFVGRLGLLTFGLAILARRNKLTKRKDEADLAL
ncbi:Ktr system potassium uptake protein B [Mariniflexile rhizosphaerae]|uniref:TrkH family potassium uptake protein n=1 Tax=unclassified Mariniflexile TaxID=2643887 RepID=UPI000CB5042A|nr:potassium transporter TrkG [Mariniflexile sp. TRM1-10]AXP82674.1 Ktr system potassium uptake protein B [Mariniflexile sp. TRM1-10]PLB18921.1 MAG: Potassium uptake protein, KtrB [Flavobacteriaceae bacterium FS1-H7996/R]